MVYLVGAGPGDPGLMTRRSLELVATADVILYDRLIPAGALDGARAGAELRYVGKTPGVESMPQDEINRLLVEFKIDRAGRYVLVDHALSRAERGLVGFLIVQGNHDDKFMHAGPARQ